MQLATLSLLDRNPPLHPLYTLVFPVTALAPLGSNPQGVLPQGILSEAFEKLSALSPGSTHTVRLEVAADLQGAHFAQVTFKSFTLYLSISGEDGTAASQSALSYPEPGVFVATVRLARSVIGALVAQPLLLQKGLLAAIHESGGQLSSQLSWSARIGFNFDIKVVGI